MIFLTGGFPWQPFSIAGITKHNVLGNYNKARGIAAEIAFDSYVQTKTKSSLTSF